MVRRKSVRYARWVVCIEGLGVGRGDRGLRVWWGGGEGGEM